MYATVNYPTKKALKEAVKAGTARIQSGVTVVPEPQDGETWLEGPWYPKPHTWYAQVELEAGRVVRVL